jgi:hypothetical protein
MSGNRKEGQAQINTYESGRGRGLEQSARCRSRVLVEYYSESRRIKFEKAGKFDVESELFYDPPQPS